MLTGNGIVRTVRRRARPTPHQMTPPHSCVRMRTRVQGAKLSLDDDLDESVGNNSAFCCGQALGFAMGYKAQTAVIAKSMARICNAVDRAKPRCVNQHEGGGVAHGLRSEIARCRPRQSPSPGSLRTIRASVAKTAGATTNAQDAPPSQRHQLLTQSTKYLTSPSTSIATNP